MIYFQSSKDFYDWIDGDWAWYDIPLVEDDFEYRDCPVAQTNEGWYINAFSVHPELGISILEHEVEVFKSRLQNKNCWVLIISLISVRRLSSFLRHGGGSENGPTRRDFWGPTAHHQQRPGGDDGRHRCGSIRRLHVCRNWARR